MGTAATASRTVAGRRHHGAVAGLSRGTAIKAPVEIHRAVSGATKKGLVAAGRTGMKNDNESKNK